MKRTTQKLSVVLALCALLATADGSLLAQRPRSQSSIVSGGQIAAGIAGIVGAVVLITIGVYFGVKHNHQSLTGCARAGADGMTLTSESDKRNYSLTGGLTQIKSNHRVRVSGKKAKDKSSPAPKFLVEKVSKDYGPCEVARAAH